MAEKKSGGSLIWGGVALMVVGVVLAALSAFMAFSSSGIADTLTSQTASVPGDFTRTLDSGKYVVYAQSGYGNGMAQSAPFSAAAVTVTGPGGAVPVSDPGMTETVTRGNTVYLGVASFQAPTAGDYQINVSTDVATQVIVGRSLGSSFGQAAAWFVGIFIGGLAALVGLALLIIGVVKRSRSKVPDRQLEYPLAGVGGAAAATPSAAAPAQPPVPPASGPAVPGTPAAAAPAVPPASGPAAPGTPAAAPSPVPPASGPAAPGTPAAAQPPVPPASGPAAPGTPAGAPPPVPPASGPAAPGTPAAAAPPPVVPPPAVMAAPPTAAALPPAGWYPDPEQVGARRFWDGAAWTDHRA